jgi:hypothetical protein
MQSSINNYLSYVLSNKMSNAVNSLILTFNGSNNIDDNIKSLIDDFYFWDKDFMKLFEFNYAKPIGSTITWLQLQKIFHRYIIMVIGQITIIFTIVQYFII